MVVWNITHKLNFTAQHEKPDRNIDARKGELFVLKIIWLIALAQWSIFDYIVHHSRHYYRR